MYLPSLKKFVAIFNNLGVNCEPIGQRSSPIGQRSSPHSTHLVSSTHKAQLVHLKKVLHNISPKGVGNPTVTVPPSHNILMESCETKSLDEDRKVNQDYGKEVIIGKIK